ncbi:hypothetical protein G6011_06771 [Alternaria panax]|uniref:Uncharacterized protein n=1 Tax=Alternaria panax TaxID=48097 RepID=A0AAD4FJ47_9PLEO|nr:hypothetical protein G6011_06771 [Alternaria panax]
MGFFTFFFFLWLVCTDLAASTPVSVPNPLVSPRRPSPPSDIAERSLASTSLQLSCNLVVPDTQSWTIYKDEVAEFSQRHWDRFRQDTSYTTFPLYLRDQFAHDLLPSSVTCDSIGQCGLTSCRFLNSELSQHDKQMAYFVFEQISGVDHLYKSQREGMREGRDYFDVKVPELIRTFSAVPRIQQQLQDRLNDRRRYEKLALSVVTAVGLMAGGAMAIPAFGVAETVAATMTNLLTNTYVSVVGSFNAFRRDPERLSSDLEENLRSSLNEVGHAMITNVTNDMQSLMERRPNGFGQDLMDVLGGDYFFRRDENIQEAVRQTFETVIFASIVSGAWAQERSYIVWADVPYGKCEYDMRGPQESRVCLTEYPNSVYYMSALDFSREHDHFSDDMALIHGPTGYRNFIKGRTQNPYGITKEDIVRSSIFVHENSLQDAIHDMDYPKVSNAVQRAKASGKDYGKVPGSFRLPITRNPGGEAISSVWVKKARNYPCMSGEFGWNDGTWTYAADQTEDFLYHTGLMFSEDWERFCHRNGECQGENGINLHEKLERRRRPGDPEIPKRLKHPFKKCKQDTEHGQGEPWHDNDRNPPLERSVRQNRTLSEDPQANG